MEAIYKRKGQGKTRNLVESFKAAKEPKALVVMNQAEKARIVVSFFTIKEGLTFEERYKILTFEEFLRDEKRLFLQQGTKVFVDNLDILLVHFDSRLNYVCASITNLEEG